MEWVEPVKRGAICNLGGFLWEFLSWTEEKPKFNPPLGNQLVQLVLAGCGHPCWHGCLSLFTGLVRPKWQPTWLFSEMQSIMQAKQVTMLAENSRACDIFLNYAATNYEMDQHCSYSIIGLLYGGLHTKVSSTWRSQHGFGWCDFASPHGKCAVPNIGGTLIPCPCHVRGQLSRAEWPREWPNGRGWSVSSRPKRKFCWIS